MAFWGLSQGAIKLGTPAQRTFADYLSFQTPWVGGIPILSKMLYSALDASLLTILRRFINSFSAKKNCILPSLSFSSHFLFSLFGHLSFFLFLFSFCRSTLLCLGLFWSLVFVVKWTIYDTTHFFWLTLVHSGWSPLLSLVNFHRFFIAQFFISCHRLRVSYPVSSVR